MFKSALADGEKVADEVESLFKDVDILVTPAVMDASFDHTLRYPTAEYGRLNGGGVPSPAAPGGGAGSGVSSGGDDGGGGGGSSGDGGKNDTNDEKDVLNNYLECKSRWMDEWIDGCYMPFLSRKHEDSAVSD